MGKGWRFKNRGWEKDPHAGDDITVMGLPVRMVKHYAQGMPKEVAQRLTANLEKLGFTKTFKDKVKLNPQPEAYVPNQIEYLEKYPGTEFRDYWRAMHGA